MRSWDNIALPIVLLGMFLLVLVALVGIARRLIEQNRTIVTLKPFEAGIEYRDGAFVQVLGEGRHLRWGTRTEIARVDLREGILQIGGQEILTRDNLAVKASVILVHVVEDAQKFIETSQNAMSDLYFLGQAAIRAAVAERTLDEVLAARQDFADAIASELRPTLAARGLKLISVSLRDVMLAAEIKRAFNDILRAKKEAEAALERARGETAALRSLANAARVLKDNPALHSLRLLQVVQAAAQKGSSIVLNAGAEGGNPQNGLPQGVTPIDSSNVTKTDDAT